MIALATYAGVVLVVGIALLVGARWLWCATRRRTGLRSQDHRPVRQISDSA
jgi:hypothetical protein